MGNGFWTHSYVITIMKPKPFFPRTEADILVKEFFSKTYNKKTELPRRPLLRLPMPPPSGAPPRFSRTTWRHPAPPCRTTWRCSLAALPDRRIQCAGAAISMLTRAFPLPLPGPVAPGMVTVEPGLWVPIHLHPRPGGRRARSEAPRGCGDGPVALLLPARGPERGQSRPAERPGCRGLRGGASEQGPHLPGLRVEFCWL